MMSRAWTVAGLAAALLTASCDDPASVEPDPAAGTYALATVDGNALPYVEWSGISGFTTILSGEIALRPDGTFRQITDRRHTFRDPQGEVLDSDTLNGTYTHRESTVVLTPATGKADTLSLEGTVATRRAPTVSSGPTNPVPWIYRR